MTERIEASRVNHYRPVTLKVLRDRELSGLARGIYSYLITNNYDKYKFVKKNIEAEFSEGRDSFNKAWKQLVEKGWIKSERIRDKETGKYSDWQHTVFDDNPDIVFDWKTGRPRKIEREGGDTDIRKTESRKTESRKSDTHKKDNSKKDNSKNLKQYASNEAFEELWFIVSKFWRGATSPIGSKEKARKKFLTLPSDLIPKIRKAAHAHAQRVLELNNAQSPNLNLPHLITWLNDNRYNASPDDYYPEPKPKNDRSNVQNNTKHNFDDQITDWGVPEDGRII